MQFNHTEEQLAIAEAIDDVISGLGGTAIAREWAAGDHTRGIAVWEQFAELGLGSLRVAESDGGMGGDLSDLVHVFERLGYGAVPGPYVESMAFLPGLVSDAERAELAAGACWSAAVDPAHPHALDANVASRVFAIGVGGIYDATVGELLDSITPFRRLHRVEAGAALGALDQAALARSLNEASLANSALLLGAGERLLTEAVSYARVREQFGKQIGEYQAIKHQLANVRVALSFVRPLLWSAALSVDAASPNADRDVSAAKVRAAAAARLAARVSLQVHGAIGYTAEHDLSLWLNWVPALTGAWGTPAEHRTRIAAAILD